MPVATARLETVHGSKYLQQLCKHFAHKTEVQYTPEHGECRFSCGDAVLDADPQGLSFHISSPDAEQLGQTKHVIERHLVNFAFRENFQTLDWSA